MRSSSIYSNNGYSGSDSNQAHAHLVLRSELCVEEIRILRLLRRLMRWKIQGNCVAGDLCDVKFQTKSITAQNTAMSILLHRIPNRLFQWAYNTETSILLRSEYWNVYVIAQNTETSIYCIEYWKVYFTA